MLNLPLIVLPSLALIALLRRYQKIGVMGLKAFCLMREKRSRVFRTRHSQDWFCARRPHLHSGSHIIKCPLIVLETQTAETHSKELPVDAGLASRSLLHDAFASGHDSGAVRRRATLDFRDRPFVSLLTHTLDKAGLEQCVSTYLMSFRCTQRSPRSTLHV